MAAKRTPRRTLSQAEKRERVFWKAEAAYLKKHLPGDRESRRALGREGRFKICEAARAAGRAALAKADKAAATRAKKKAAAKKPKD